MAEWQQVLPGVLMWPDSCNVYAIMGPDGILIVDAGTGEWIDHVGELPDRPVALACTHFFRDHSAGAARAAGELGLRVLVPEREKELFSDPLEHFRGRKTYLVYVNYWDRLRPDRADPGGRGPARLRTDRSRRPRDRGDPVARRHDEPGRPRVHGTGDFAASRLLGRDHPFARARAAGRTPPVQLRWSVGRRGGLALRCRSASPGCRRPPPQPGRTDPHRCQRSA